ncbi:hypothetical protein HPP92_023080 [Vanilla planifolia]|uniref:Uncharacterized protein n=1 Tax=Vanilla planifolia TaxID=51239 RepID=A0A835UFQ4_VANPL|nr:hypothetical protein HPP92_023402 [Vanilla planifolia]KAG0459952.1 hypothetical protein HPP92_023080 [Vanilla planifolia]
MNEDREEESQDSLAASISFRLPEDQGGIYVDPPQHITDASGGTAFASDDEFEFSFVVGSSKIDSPITADEIFSDGRILPIYPAFPRDQLLGGQGDEERSDRQRLLNLLMEERELSSSSSSTSADELEGIPPETYCVWKPRSVPQSPERVRKTCSTGSSFRVRIRDLVVGRSHSDGKEKFRFLEVEEKKTTTHAPTAGAAEEEKKRMEKGKKVSEVDLVTAYRKYYVVAKGSVGGRKSFLPYKSVGFFTGVNGISWVHHPF